VYRLLWILSFGFDKLFNVLEDCCFERVGFVGHVYVCVSRSLKYITITWSMNKAIMLQKTRDIYTKAYRKSVCFSWARYCKTRITWQGTSPFPLPLVLRNPLLVKRTIILLNLNLNFHEFKKIILTNFIPLISLSKNISTNTHVGTSDFRYFLI